jgi:hypothetical protein
MLLSKLFKHQCTIANRENLVIFGGCAEDGKNYSDNFYALNLVTFKWVVLPRLPNQPCPRVYHTMLALSMEQREDLLVCGGFNGTQLRDLCILNFSMVPEGIYYR